MNPLRDPRFWTVVWLCFILPILVLNLSNLPEEQLPYAAAITFICADRVRRDAISLVVDILKNQ